MGIEGRSFGRGSWGNSSIVATELSWEIPQRVLYADFTHTYKPYGESVGQFVIKRESPLNEAPKGPE